MHKFRDFADHVVDDMEKLPKPAHYVKDSSQNFQLIGLLFLARTLLCGFYFLHIFSLSRMVKNATALAASRMRFSPQKVRSKTASFPPSCHLLPLLAGSSLSPTRGTARESRVQGNVRELPPHEALAPTATRVILRPQEHSSEVFSKKQKYFR